MLSPDKVQNLPLDLPLPPALSLEMPEAQAETTHKWSKEKIMNLGLCALAGVTILTGSSGEDVLQAAAHAVGLNVSISEEVHHAETIDGDLLDVVNVINGSHAHPEEGQDKDAQTPLKDAAEFFTISVPFVEDPKKSPLLKGGNIPIKSANVPTFKLPFSITETGQPDKQTTNQ